MKKNISINYEDSQLIVSKAFYKKAAVFGSAEYHELRQAMHENPEFKIEFKIIKKKTYRNLSFGAMEDYIKMQTNSKELLEEFNQAKRIAKAKGSLYPQTKKWFLNTFPAYKVNEITEDEIHTCVAQIAEVRADTTAEISSITDTVA